MKNDLYDFLPDLSADDVSTVDKSTWVENLKTDCLSLLEVNISYNNPYIQCIDYKTSKWFVDNVDIAGYMIQPTCVCLYNDQPRVLVTKTIQIHDFKDFLGYIDCKKDKIYMYQIIFLPNFPQCNEIDLQTFKIIDFKRPVIDSSKGFWKIRFAEIEE